jgi:hypothetical protein
MKKIVCFLVVSAFLAMGASTVLAGDLPKPVEKFTKGAVEVIKSPIVIYDHTKGEYDKSDIKPLGFIKGLVESPFLLVKKAGGGALEMATFPVE